MVQPGAVKSKNIFALLSLLIICFSASAQSPYVLNGTATQDDCHCYTLTTDSVFQSAAIWNKNKIDLSKPFDYSFNIYAGCSDSTGADGMAFVLQPLSSSLGIEGAGMGFQNIYPSLGVTIDTYQNIDQDDPYYDHVSLQANGDTYHKSVNNLAGPVRALENNDNIEDCKWHKLEIKWQPANNLLEVSIDGTLRLSLQQDIISSIFNNDPSVFWGFTAGTGYIGNVQRVCTAVDPGFILPDNHTCVQTPLGFLDTSKSFGNISNWYWSFGDGSISSQQNPTHIYDSPGPYTVMLNILGGEGCLSDTIKQQLVIGSYPKASFTMDTSIACSDQQVKFNDATYLEMGKKNYWYWNLGNGIISNERNPVAKYNPGKYNIDLFVNTEEGCASDTFRKTITIKQSPSISFTKNDACLGSQVHFSAKDLSDAVGISQWYWNFDDNNVAQGADIFHTYLKSGNYNVKLAAEAKNGCISDTITEAVSVYTTRAYAGTDTTILEGRPYQLNASGGDSYTWSPSTGLSNANIANPVATLYNDITYIVTASTVLGCATEDSVHLKVVKGPVIYVPTAFTPNGDGRNDRFKFVPVGISEIGLFQILNRWGQVIYSSKNAAEGWDGTLNGLQQPAGTYVWMVAGKAIDGAIIKKQGTLVLIR